MSAEEAVTEGLQTPLDHNAQAAADAEKMLAELQGETTADEPVKETNGADKPTEEAAEKDASEEKEDRSERRHDRSDRGGRDRGGRERGRGGRNGFGNRNYRDNIKSDLTSQEISSDPVAIRKQVRHSLHLVLTTC